MNTQKIVSDHSAMLSFHYSASYSHVATNCFGCCFFYFTISFLEENLKILSQMKRNIKTAHVTCKTQIYFLWTLLLFLWPSNKNMKHFDDPFLSIFDYFNSMKFRAFVTRTSLNLSALFTSAENKHLLTECLDSSRFTFLKISFHSLLHQKELKLSEGDEPWISFLFSSFLPRFFIHVLINRWSKRLFIQKWKLKSRFNYFQIIKLF